MLINTYNTVYNDYFGDAKVQEQLEQAVEFFKDKKRIFFIGNGGSNSICSHMMEDYAKIARYKTFAFSDAALITCYANDYGYANALKEWIDLNMEAGDVLVAISSSGNSENIINGVHAARKKGGHVMGLSGFDPGNKLHQLGDINFHIPSKSYGIVECFHQVILHAILDEMGQAK